MSKKLLTSIITFVDITTKTPSAYQPIFDHVFILQTHVPQADLTTQLATVFKQIQLPEDAHREVREALQKDDVGSRKSSQDNKA